MSLRLLARLVLLVVLGGGPALAQDAAGPATPDAPAEAAAPAALAEAEAAAAAEADADAILPLPEPAPASADPLAEAGAAAARAAAISADRRTEQVEANLAAVREVLDIGLSGDEAGELLREARRRAPEPPEESRRLAERQRTVANARLDRVRLLERRRLAAESNDAEEADRLTGELVRQQDYLEALILAEAAESRLVERARTLVGLLDARLLWIGSAPPVGRAWLVETAAGFRWASRPKAWATVGREVLRTGSHAPVGAALWTVSLGGLLLFRRRLCRRLARLAEGVGSYTSDSFRLTAQALGVTFLLALPLPLLLTGPGLALTGGGASLRGGLAGGDNFSQSVGAGLLAAGGVAFALGFLGRVCRPGGLADAHFGWDEHARTTLSRWLRRLMAVEVPAAFVVAATDAGGQEALRQGFGRAAFLVGSIALTVFVVIVFRPGRGVFARMLQPDSWAWRLRRFWFGALVAVPAGLSLAAAGGYYFTATEVLGRFFTSGVVALLAVVGYSLASRYLYVARRRVAIAQARRRLAEARAARAAAPGTAVDPASPAEAAPRAKADVDELDIDVEAIGEQTRRLLRVVVGLAVAFLLYGVWVDLLPALSGLSRVTLTPATLDAEGQVLVRGLNLWSAILAIGSVFLTWVAARNLPALAELVVLQRFPLDAGTRYAAATLLRYVVVAIGVVVVSRLLGIEWGRAQWIIAALGVGLGFGLQEIVANFVSGLIILFERPVRVGDTVTVGNVSGTVSRLAIRATTITDWDNKEVLVPNKSYITDPVVNWTLSNPVTRVILPVGIAYGCDAAHAREVIVAAVARVATVMPEPTPQVLFVGFGDSSLQFEVRCFVPDLGKRLPTLHELHLAIHRGLGEAGIEIPFPQRDVHVRSGVLPADGEVSRG